MATKLDPFLGLQYGDAKGADNWHIWNDSNLILLGSTQHIYVKSATTTTPAGIVNGERWIVPAGATGAWAAHVGELACAVEGYYAYVAPKSGMRAIAEDTERLLFYFDSAWVDEDDFGTLPAVAITCFYPLTASLAEIQAVLGGSVGKLTLDGTEQIASYNYVAASASKGAMISGAPASGPYVDFTTGSKTVEVAFSLPALVAATGQVSAYFYLLSSDGNNSVVVLFRATTAGSYEYTITGNVAGVFTTFLAPVVTATPPTVFAVSLNAGVLTVYGDGVPITLDISAAGSFAATPLLQVVQTAVAGADIGKTGTVALRTDKGLYDYVYTGKQDACGNAI